MFISDRGLHDRIRTIALSFWDAYLKGDAKAKEKLNAAQIGSNATVEKK